MILKIDGTILLCGGEEHCMERILLDYHLIILCNAC